MTSHLGGLYCQAGSATLILKCGFLGYYFNIMYYNSIHIKFILAKRHFFNIIILFSLICIRIKRNLGVVSPKLPVKYPQIPAFINDQIETVLIHHMRIPL